MAKQRQTGKLGGIWSATPTPLTEKMTIDGVAVKRLVEHHVKLGVNGLFLCGTCGEGPLLPDDMRRTMLQKTVQASRGRLLLSMQVTDNSVERMLANIKTAKADGANIAVIAPPYVAPPSTALKGLRELYIETIRQSPLPIGIYDRGRYSPVFVPPAILKDIYAEKNVVMAKDSSASTQRRNLALAAREKRKGLSLLSGWEFNCVPYIKAGYDGLMLGGGIINGYIAGQLVAAVRAGQLQQANALQDRINSMLWDTYGGKKITCWLSGLKKLLVEMGVFRTWRNFADYPLTPACCRAIERVLRRDADILFPWKKS